MPKNESRENQLARFMRHVDKSADGCWLWTGYLHHGDGYGRFSIVYRKRLAHRVAYVLLRGEIPEGKELDHLCRNRACVNPEHLEPVTHAENVLRGVGFSGLNARKTHCRKGHPFDAQNTRSGPSWTRPGRVKRICRECENDSQRRCKTRRAIANVQTNGA